MLSRGKAPFNCFALADLRPFFHFYCNNSLEVRGKTQNSNILSSDTPVSPLIRVNIKVKHNLPLQFCFVSSAIKLGSDFFLDSLLLRVKNSDSNRSGRNFF